MFEWNLFIQIWIFINYFIINRKIISVKNYMNSYIELLYTNLLV